jgi:hypothetical protein
MADEWNVSDDELRERVVAHYRQAFLESPRAAAWLAERCVDADTAAVFGVGFSDRTLGLALPSPDRAGGRQLRARLQDLGVLRSTGHEQFRGCVVVPVRDNDGRVTQLCGLRVDRPQRRTDRPSTPADAVLWLTAASTAIFNSRALGAGGDLILAGDVLEALAWWSAGFHHVIAPAGPQGWSSNLAEQLRSAKVERALLAMPRTATGEATSGALATELSCAGVECFRVVFPPGWGVVAVAQHADDVADALAERLREATWLAGGARPAVGAPGATSSVGGPALASPVPSAPRADGLEVEGGELRLTTDTHSWRVRGLDRIPATASGSLRVNVSVREPDSERFHLDVVDLYAARARQAFIANAAAELGADEDTLRRELGRVLVACEDRLVELGGQHNGQPGTPVLTAADEEAALDLLRDPELMNRIGADIARLGLVGEVDNALVAYLAATSRLLDAPLAVVVQSGSAAGKSTLVDAVLSLMPDEQRLAVSAVTGQSLFYLGETELAHKILSVAEADGASRAAYPLRLLQSEGELSIASTGKDPAGGLITRTYRSRGPVALFLTTTAPALDDELANRCVVLGVDEDQVQTRAILAAQRDAETLEGLLARREREGVRRLHANAQRLLEPVAVVNPLAPTLGFADGRTRARRDQAKYLSLIRAVALLHQHQRPRHRAVHHGVELVYIEATAADVAVADRLAPVIFGDRVGELAPQTRRLLTLLEVMVRDQGTGAHCSDEVRFTRRQAREHTGWSDFALRRHLARLVDLELLAVQRRGHAFSYALLWQHDRIAGYDARSDGVAMASRGQSVRPETAGQ